MDVAVIARVLLDEGTLTVNIFEKNRQNDWRSTYSSRKSQGSVDMPLAPLIPAGMTMAEMAMRFILNDGRVSTIIPGMRKLKHVDVNIATSAAGPLPGELHAKLRQHRWDRSPTKWSQ
jgi:aryl-alcohol dehydrogenase-like predicted oxidoreductase